MQRTESPELRGIPVGGPLRVLADPIAQALAVLVVVSVVFSVFPRIDLWFSGLFAKSGAGFPAARLAAFAVLNQVGPLCVAAVLIALVAAVVWKLVHPDRATILPANGIAFLLASLVLTSGLTPLLLLAADSKRSPPAGIDVFGGTDRFVGLWHQGGMCSTDCAAFSFDTAWAVWLIGLVAVVPARRRSAALGVLIGLAALMVLNVLARGEEYLSGVLVSASFTAVVVSVVYRLTMDRPVSPRFADGTIEAELTRIGREVHRVLGEADWHAVALKAQSPWRNRRGEFSLLKAATFAMTVLPGAWLLWLTLTGGLTPLPWVFLIYTSGIWALWLFLASLAVTPARQIFGWSELISVRRMLGIGGLAYTVLHVLDYVWLDRFSLGFIINEYLTRATVWVATLATAGILILGATSLDKVIQRMGSPAWTRLHYIAYPAIGLAALHFDMSPASLGGPMYFITGMFFWLMAWRVLQHYRLGTSPLVLAALALATPAASFVFEIAWLDLFQRLPPERTVGFVTDIGGGLNETWQLLVVGLAIAALAAVFGRKSQSQARLGVRLPTVAVPRPRTAAGSLIEDAFS